MTSAIAACLCCHNLHYSNAADCVWAKWESRICTRWYEISTQKGNRKFKKTASVDASRGKVAEKRWVLSETKCFSLDSSTLLKPYYSYVESHSNFYLGRSLPCYLAKWIPFIIYNSIFYISTASAPLLFVSTCFLTWSLRSMANIVIERNASVTAAVASDATIEPVEAMYANQVHGSTNISNGSVLEGAALRTPS